MFYRKDKGLRGLKLRSFAFLGSGRKANILLPVPPWRGSMTGDVLIMNKDLTTGDPWSVIWRFCLPLFGSVIFQQLYNLADSFVAGRYIGENALAAVGNSYEITLIFIAFAMGCNIGCSVITARYFGAKDMLHMKTSVYTSLISTAVLCGVLMLGGLLLGNFLLEAINTPAEIYADSALYLRIYIWGLPFLFFYNLSTGIFTALGDSRTPFYFLAASSTANILVDIFFVTKLEMGVAGVAWATFLCQGISAILAVIFVLRRLKGVQTKEKAPLFSRVIFGQLCVIAIPSILQQSFISVGNIIIQSVINGFGAGTIAGYAAAIKLNNLVISSFTTISSGLSNYASQNLGAGILPRIRQGFKAGLRLVWMIALPLTALYLLGGRLLLGIFLEDPTADALSTGLMILRILSPFYIIVSAKLIADAILRGTGQMKQFMIGTFTDLILRVVLAIVLAGHLGSLGIWCAWPVGWTLSTLLSLYFYKKGSWENRTASD